MAEQGTVISEDSVRLKSADEPAVAVSDSETQRQTAPPERKEIQSNPVEESGTRAPVAAAPENAARPDPPEPIASPSRGSLDWFSDYRTAYSTAIAEHSRLVMLFVEPTADSGMPDALAATETEPLLKPFVRLKLPVDATVDGSADRLLAHRSFRHLGGQPGLVIVEFSDPQSPLSGQVVSALPLPDDGQFPLQVLKQLLVLPAGSIGQRSLLLAIRSGFPSSESNFPPPATHPVLNALANRNVRFMADSGRVDLFEQEQYRETVRRTFGDAVQARELLFATTESVSIQTAAEQAVAQWNQQPDTVDTVITSATAYGLDLFQAPASGRWFATLVVVK